MTSGLLLPHPVQTGHLGREGIHLAQLLAGMLGDHAGQQGTEDRS